jgi:hypothetical protein
MANSITGSKIRFSGKTCTLNPDLGNSGSFAKFAGIEIAAIHNP